MSLHTFKQSSNTMINHESHFSRCGDSFRRFAEMLYSELPLTLFFFFFPAQEKTTPVYIRLSLGKVTNELFVMEAFSLSVCYNAVFFF